VSLSVCVSLFLCVSLCDFHSFSVRVSPGVSLSLSVCLSQCVSVSLCVLQKFPEMPVPTRQEC